MKPLYTLIFAFFISCSTEPEDCAGVGGIHTAVVDCAGVCNGNAIIDECGICGDGNNFKCIDCLFDYECFSGTYSLSSVIQYESLECNGEFSDVTDNINNPSLIVILNEDGTMNLSSGSSGSWIVENDNPISTMNITDNNDYQEEWISTFVGDTFYFYFEEANKCSKATLAK